MSNNPLSADTWASEFDSAIDGLLTVGLGVYLAMVLVRGNTKPFLAEVVKEGGFIEFLIAIAILNALRRIPGAQPLVGPFVFVAIFILAARIISGSSPSAFADFAAGRIGLFQFAGNVFNSQA